MQIKWLYNYYTLFCIHVCIVLLAFTSFFRHPNISTLSDHGGDETKNYFTLNSYVKEPIGEDGILKYNHLSYPFGDYVYYTDNTPLFSVPFRWYCHHISDISNKAIPIFNLFIILNIILSGLLVFSILKYLLADNKIAFIMAIILPWTNVQVLRIMHGHFNLSLSSLFLLGIYLLILWHKNKDAKGKLITIGFAMFLLSMVSFFIHGYYIAILTTFIAAMLFTYGIWNFKQRIGKISIATVIIYPAITLVSALLIVSQTDKYLPLRKDIANGYDWMDQKALFTSLFSNYYFQHLYVPICNLKNPAAVEQAGYMGNVSLFAVLIIGIIAFLKKGFRSEIRAIQIDFFKDSLRASIFIGSLVMLFISFGEHYYTGNRIDNNGMEIFNILNPYYLIHKFTNRVEQFRCLGRFLWPFYFGFNIWVLYTIVVLYKRSEKNIRLFIILAMLFVGGFETVDFAQEIHRRVRISHNYFNTTTLDSFKTIHVDFNKCQAILPIPYYFAGSEDYNYTIDDKEQWSDYTFKLSSYSGLPLMSSKMSRTPPMYNIILMKMVTKDSLDKVLIDKLNDKPVLVVVNKKEIKDSTAFNIPINEPAKSYYWQATQFADRNHLQAIDSTGDVIFYYWYPKGKK